MLTRAGRHCGVLGDPVGHSLSPALHRAAYAELGLDWTYDAHRVASGGLGEFLAGLDAQWRGVSLTMPLKREALPLMDRVTDRARQAGAVNTVVLEDDGTRVGDNTDLPGAAAAVRERTTIPLATATILGGGATATSIGLALAEVGVRSIAVAVRDAARATETVAALRAHPAAPDVVVSPLGEAPTAVDVLVSTIPVTAQTPELVARCADVPVVFDALYDPWPTPLVAAASDRTVVGGLDLLVHQAVLQVELFTGRTVAVEVLRDAGERALAARSAG